MHGFVFKGRWHYLEHEWVAEEGGYVYEPRGEAHTLVLPDDVKEMVTCFQITGVMCYVNPRGKIQGNENMFSQVDLC